jgi:hypothetical protein
LAYILGSGFPLFHGQSRDGDDQGAASPGQRLTDCLNRAPVGGNGCCYKSVEDAARPTGQQYAQSRSEKYVQALGIPKCIWTNQNSSLTRPIPITPTRFTPIA